MVQVSEDCVNHRQAESMLLLDVCFNSRFVSVIPCLDASLYCSMISFSFSQSPGSVIITIMARCYREFCFLLLLIFCVMMCHYVSPSHNKAMRIFSGAVSGTSFYLLWYCSTHKLLTCSLIWRCIKDRGVSSSSLVPPILSYGIYAITPGDRWLGTQNQWRATHFDDVGIVFIDFSCAVSGGFSSVVLCTVFSCLTLLGIGQYEARRCCATLHCHR